VCICIKKQTTTPDALQKSQEAILAVAGETLAQQDWAGLNIAGVENPMVYGQ
jgi:flavin reductase (DIM6/NTAB) family NADH-FMN oxidoreductase RutF